MADFWGFSGAEPIRFKAKNVDIVKKCKKGESTTKIYFGSKSSNIVPQ